jgi:multisubunit Na+/H+ antiporter MnhF subunit
MLLVHSGKNIFLRVRAVINILEFLESLVYRRYMVDRTYLSDHENA